MLLQAIVVTPLQNIMSHHYKDHVTPLQRRRNTLQRPCHTITITMSHHYKHVGTRYKDHGTRYKDLVTVNNHAGTPYNHVVTPNNYVVTPNILILAQISNILIHKAYALLSEPAA